MKSKAILSFIFSFFLMTSSAWADDGKSNTSPIIKEINETVNTGIGGVTDFVVKYVFYSIEVSGVKVPLVLVWLIGGALFFTIYFGFINIKGFKYAINLVRGKYDLPGETMDWDGDEVVDAPQDKKADGEVSHFQALTTALSGTVGLGNIAGVAVAVAAGGPGATFWMILAGILGMSSKFVECTLGVKYRKVKANGDVSGGPMYYLTEGLKEKGMGHLGKVLGIFFAIMCIGGSFGGGNMFQANQARAQFASLEIFEGTFIQGDSGSILFGIVLAIAVGVVIIGGIKSIAKVTDKIVPFMCGLYVICAIIVLVAHASDIPGAFGDILSGAFTMKAGLGGFLGVLIQGFKRAAFSNEAGIGSAAIAHSAVQTDEPVTEGLVALLEPFIDTVVVCTMTALVLVITGVYDDPNLEGVSMTAKGFESVFGGAANAILAIAVVLFAFSTMISWSYYGLKSWSFLFGDSTASEISYKIIFCLFVVVGSILTLGKVVDFSDSMIFAMCFPNIIGLYILSPVVKTELNAFIEKVKRGKIPEA